MAKWMAETGKTPHFIDLLNFKDVVNLKGGSLSGTVLGGKAFIGVDLGGVDLSYTNCAKTDFRGAWIQNANLNGAVLHEAIFDWPTRFTNSIGMEFVYIPPGIFMMGSPQTEVEREKNEKLNDIEKSVHRLPTEVEWEYACRAGTKTKFHTGDTEEDLSRAGWYGKNAGLHTHPVGEKVSNVWGLYDMHGNVWEWCWNWYEDYPNGPVSDPISPSSRPRKAGFQYRLQTF